MAKKKATKAKKVVAHAAKPPAKKTAAKKPAARAGKYVYFFGAGKADGDRTLRDLLGGKGANLAEMTNAGLPVPPGMTITTAACNLWFEKGRRLTPEIE